MCPNISLLYSDIADEIPANIVNSILQWSDHVSDRTTIKQVCAYFFACVVPLMPSFRMRPLLDYVSLICDWVCSQVVRKFQPIDAIRCLSHFASIMLEVIELWPEWPWKNVMVDCWAQVVAVTGSSSGEKR